MRALNTKENRDEILFKFDKKQLDVVLAFIQNNHSLVSDQDLMLGIGLSINTIKRYTSQLNLAIIGGVWVVTDKGLEQFEVAVKSLDQIGRYNLISNYYKLIEPKKYLGLMGLSWQEFCDVIRVVKTEGCTTQKRTALEAFRHLSNLDGQVLVACT